MSKPASNKLQLFRASLLRRPQMSLDPPGATAEQRKPAADDELDGSISPLTQTKLNEVVAAEATYLSAYSSAKMRDRGCLHANCY